MRRSPRAAALVLALAGAAAGSAAAEPPAPVAGIDRGSSYYHYCLSRQAWFERDYDSALDHMKKASDADPGSVELAVDLASLLIDLADATGAAEAAQRAVDLAPDLVGPREVLARALLLVAEGDQATVEDQEAAIRAHADLLRLDPDRADAYLALARLHIAGDRFETALEALRKHLTRDPGSEEGVFLAAHVLGRLGRHAEAEPLLLTTVERRPFDPRLRIALVEHYENRGDLEAAYREARRLLQMRMDPVRAHLTLARLSERTDRTGEALQHYQEIARLMDEREGQYPIQDRAEVQFRVVLLLLHERRLDEAIREADAGITDYPTDDRFGIRKGEALLLKGRVREARDALGEELAREGNDTVRLERISDAYLSAGAREERAGKVEEAERHLKHSIQLDPANDVALNYLGYMLAERNERIDEAIGYIERALRREPGNGAYLDSLGWALFRKGDFRGAERYLDEALAVLSEEPAVHEHLAEVYYATRRYQDALDAWQRALDHGAEDPEAIRSRMAAARRAAGLEP